MSYSFTVTAPTRRELVLKVNEEFDKVCKAQACHYKDAGATIATATAFIHTMSDAPAGKGFGVSINGSISGQGNDVAKVESMQVSLRVYHA